MVVIVLIIIFSPNNQSKERCSTGWAETHTSHSPEECPNHLDYQHYWLFLVPLTQVLFNWSDPGPWPLQLPSEVDSFNASAHLFHTSVWHLHICSMHLLNGTYHQLNDLSCLHCINNIFSKQPKLWLIGENIIINTILIII